MLCTAAFSLQPLAMSLRSHCLEREVVKYQQDRLKSPLTHHKPLPLLLLSEALLEVVVQGPTLLQSPLQTVRLHALHHPQFHGSAFVVVLGIGDGSGHVREHVTQERLRRHLEGERR